MSLGAVTIPEWVALTPRAGLCKSKNWKAPSRAPIVTPSAFRRPPPTNLRDWQVHAWSTHMIPLVMLSDASSRTQACLFRDGVPRRRFPDRRFSILKHFDALVATKRRITAPPQARLLFQPLLLVDEGE